jgi:hypothetical protein
MSLWATYTNVPTSYLLKRSKTLSEELEFMKRLVILSLPFVTSSLLQLFRPTNCSQTSLTPALYSRLFLIAI